MARAAELIDGRDGDVVVVLGRGDLATSTAATVQVAAELARLPRARFLMALRRGNVRGALDLGLTPGFLPGRVTLDAGRAWFEHVWGTVPDRPGLDAVGILDAARHASPGGLMDARKPWRCASPGRRPGPRPATRTPPSPSRRPGAGAPNSG